LNDEHRRSRASKLHVPAVPARLLHNLNLLGRLLALAVLLIYFPALVCVGLLVLVTSEGPAFVKKAYRRNCGEVVYLYEFRTECWRTWQPTSLGKVIVKSDMHRLPRLMNVLLGEVNVGERVQAVRA
jgi:lipopolysaccharide/colanic/teichoic acid biosynthesis glycosyltransferase